MQVCDRLILMANEGAVGAFVREDEVLPVAHDPRVDAGDQELIDDEMAARTAANEELGAVVERHAMLDAGRLEDQALAVVQIPSFHAGDHANTINAGRKSIAKAPTH